GDQWIAAGIEAGAGSQVELEVVAEAADDAVDDHASDSEIFARVRAVPADLVPAGRGVDHDRLVGRPSPFVGLHGVQGLRLCVLEEANEVVVVNVRMAPGGEP